MEDSSRTKALKWILSVVYAKDIQAEAESSRIGALLWKIRALQEVKDVGHSPHEDYKIVGGDCLGESKCWALGGIKIGKVLSHFPSFTSRAIPFS